MDVDKVRFRSLDGSFEIPWNSLPFNLKRQLDEQHKEALARQANLKAEQDYRSQGASIAAQLEREGGTTLIGRLLQIVPEGLLIVCDRDDTASTVSLRLQGQLQDLPVSAAPMRGYGTFLLKNHPDQKQFVDDDPIRVIALPAGTYRYTSTAGAAKTIRAYSITRPQAGGQP